jgi:DNA-binding transcriptional ArsR family regulator
MINQGEPSLKRLLGWLIAGTKGGPTRAEIISVLRETPQNANQLASRLNKDYRTIRHHLEILSKNGVITSGGDRYGMTYFLTSRMEQDYVIFEEIVGKLWERPKGNNGKGNAHE